MDDEHSDATDGIAIAESLDHLGAASVAESPMPPTRAHRVRRRAGWLVAAAALVAVVAAAVLRSGDDTTEQVAGRNPAVVPGPVAPDVDVLVEFDPATTTGGPIQATFTNRGARRLGLNCQIWRLERWVGTEWQPEAPSVLWSDEGRLALFDGGMTIDCGETEYVDPGATVLRILVPADTIRDVTDRGTGESGPVAAPLEPGRYRLVLPAFPERAVGAEDPIDVDARFEVVTEASTPTTSAAASSCTLLTATQVADLLDAEPGAAVPPTTDSAAAAAAAAEGCLLDAAPWSVSYEVFDAAPGQMGGAMMGAPVDIGDEAYIATSTNRSGRWSATGFVRVGGRGALVTIGSAATGSDTYPPSEGPAVEPQVSDKAVALMGALADRL